MAQKQPMSIRRLVIAVVVLALGLLAQRAGIDLSALGLPSASERSTPAPTDTYSENPSSRIPDGSGRKVSDSTARIESAFESRQSGFMVTVDATVEKTLPDDNQGSRHQRFLIELSTGRTLLVAHNIDLADRVQISRGDRIRVRGQYEWNDRGGVLHWTHADPQRRHEGGWIEADGRRTE